MGDRQGLPMLNVQRHIHEVSHRVDKILHVPPGLREDFPTIQGFDLGDDVPPFLNFISQPVQQNASVIREEIRPA